MNKISIRKMNIFLLVLLIVSLNFGDYVQFLGFSLSYFFAGLLLIGTVMQICLTGEIFSYSSKEHKIFLILCFFWLVYGAIQGIWAKDSGLFIQGYLQLVINMFMCFEILMLIGNKSDLNLLLSSGLISFLLTFVVGLYEFITDNHFRDDMEFGESVRTFFGNPNDCATWMCLCFFLTVLFLLINNLSKWWYLIAWGASVFTVYNTGSRACLIGLILVAVLYFFSKLVLWIEHKTKNGIVTTKYLFAFAILVVIFAIIIIVTNEHFFEWLKIFSGEGNYESDILRIDITIKTIETVVNSFFMGVGANQTIRYIDINPHNFVLELLADYGFIVFVIVMYILLSIFFRFFNAKISIGSRIFSVIFVVPLLVIGISSSSMNRIRMTWVCIVIVYLYLVILNRSKTPETVDQQKENIK